MKSQKLSSLSKMAENLSDVSSPFNLYHSLGNSAGDKLMIFFLLYIFLIFFFFLPALVAQFDVCRTGDQEVAGSTPTRSATFFCGD